MKMTEPPSSLLQLFEINLKTNFDGLKVLSAKTEGKNPPIIQTQIIVMDRQAHKSRGALQLVDAFLGFVIFFAVLRSITLLIG